MNMIGTRTIKVIVLIILVTLSLSNIASAIPVEKWNNTFGGINNDVAYSGQQTSDRGYIFAGETNSYGAGNSDMWLVKTNSSGKKQWSKTFGGAGYDSATSVQQTKDGGYILGGSSEGSSGTNALLIKTDSGGKKLWSKTYNFSTVSSPYTHHNSVFSLQQTNDGGYILGIVTGAGYWTANYSIIKIDSKGNKTWRKVLTYWKARIDSVRQTSDGGYILVGDSYYGDSWLIKYDTNGNQKWTKQLPKGFAQYGQQAKDGGYIVTGYVRNYAIGGQNAWIVKTNNNGNELWNVTLEKGATRSIKPTSDGGYILAGDNNNENLNALIIKTYSNGKKQWSKTFGGTNQDDARYAQQTSDGGYIIVGYTESYGTGGRDAWLIKIK